MIALWSICREITHDVLFQSKIRSHTKPKPWSKERFVPVSKFTKGENQFFDFLPENLISANPTKIDDLNEIILTELRSLLSNSGPPLDTRIIRKMGSKSKKDRVDLLLIGELRNEEKAWTQARIKLFMY